VTDPGETILGIDYGARRIGLAISERDGLSARPLATIPGSARDAASPDAAAVARLAAVVRQQHVTELVIGLPLEANGDHGPMAETTSAWAAALGEALGLPVTLRDERLSSHVAESRLGHMPRGRSGGPPSRTQRERYRGRVDREAAAIILQDELDARRSGQR
jgi:putative Holliday junction resolvase